jgi:hypothetical protein
MSSWIILALIPYFVQALALVVDEFHCHMRRGLPRWERLGHPLDTLSVLLVNAFAFIWAFSSTNLFLFILLSLFSCLFVTKDEWVHSSECDAFEHWLHSVLFVCHPLTFVSSGFFWVARDNPGVLGLTDQESAWAAMILGGQVVVLGVFLLYQVTYWNFLRPKVCFASGKSNLQGMQSTSADPQSSV